MREPDSMCQMYRLSFGFQFGGVVPSIWNEVTVHQYCEWPVVVTVDVDRSVLEETGGRFVLDYKKVIAHFMNDGEQRKRELAYDVDLEAIAKYIYDEIHNSPNIKPEPQIAAASICQVCVWDTKNRDVSVTYGDTIL